MLLRRGARPGHRRHLVRADGVVAKAGGKVVKNVAGYDLAKLVTGAYGTLGLVTEAAFRLHPIPPRGRVRLGPAAGRGERVPGGCSARCTRSSCRPRSRSTGRSRAAPVEVAVLVEGTEAGVAARAAQARRDARRGAARDRPRRTGGARCPPGDRSVLVKATTELTGIGRLLDGVDRAAAAAGATARGPRQRRRRRAPRRAARHRPGRGRGVRQGAAGRRAGLAGQRRRAGRAAAGACRSGQLGTGARARPDAPGQGAVRPGRAARARPVRGRDLTCRSTPPTAPGTPPGPIQGRAGPARHARLRRAPAAGPRADLGLRALRLLPAHLPDVRAVGRGDGLPARPDPADEPGAARRAAVGLDGRALRPLPRLHGLRAACPSGVQYDKLIEATRAQVERNHKRLAGGEGAARGHLRALPLPAAAAAGPRSARRVPADRAAEAGAAQRAAAAAGADAGDDGGHRSADRQVAGAARAGRGPRARSG